MNAHGRLELTAWSGTDPRKGRGGAGNDAGMRRVGDPLLLEKRGECPRNSAAVRALRVLGVALFDTVSHTLPHLCAEGCATPYRDTVSRHRIGETSHENAGWAPPTSSWGLTPSRQLPPKPFYLNGATPTPMTDWAPVSGLTAAS